MTRKNTTRYNGPMMVRTVATEADAAIAQPATPGEFLYVEETGAEKRWNGALGRFVGQVDSVVNPVTGEIENIVGGKALPKLSPAANILRVASDLTGWALGNSGTAATATVDANSPFGVPAVRIDIPNGNTYAQLTATGLGVPGYGGAAGNLTWLIYVEDASIISQCQSIIGDSGFAANDTLSWSISNSDKHNNNGVHVIPHNKVVAPTITDIRIRVFGSGVGAGQTGRVWILGAYIPEPVKPAIVLTFDDADVTFSTKVLPALRARGIHATFGINRDQVGANDSLYVTEAQLDDIYRAGNDLSSHNRTNTNLLTQGLDGYLADFDNCAAWLQGNGWWRGREYHPFVQGKHDGALVSALAARGVVFQRNATTTELMAVGAQRYTQDAVLMPIAAPLSSSTTLVAAKAKIDDAITYGLDCVFMGHVLGASADTVTWVESDFLALLDYALLKRAQGSVALVGSVSEWARLRGHRVTLG